TEIETAPQSRLTGDALAFYRARECTHTHTHTQNTRAHTHTHTHSKHTFLSLCMLHTFICRDTAEYTPTHCPGGLEPTDQQKEYQTQYQTSQHLNVSHTHLKLFSVYSPGMDYTTKNFLYKMLYTLPTFPCLHC